MNLKESKTKIIKDWHQDRWCFNYYAYVAHSLAYRSVFIYQSCIYLSHLHLHDYSCLFFMGLCYNKSLNIDCTSLNIIIYNSWYIYISLFCKTFLLSRIVDYTVLCIRTHVNWVASRHFLISCSRVSTSNNVLLKNHH